MSALGSPALVAVLSLFLGVAVHPRCQALRAGSFGRAALATLALLLVAALVARALRGTPAARLVALGAALAVAGLGWDAVRGHRGSLSLQPGQASQNFVELGPGEASLGLRPLGFQAGLERLHGTLATLSLAGQRMLVTPSQAAGHAGVRLGRPRVEHTGDVLRLRLTLTDGAGEHPIEVVPGEIARHGELQIGLAQYFADFALDARNEPFSRSREPRQPAALLDVRKGSESFRVFVLASAPNLHQVEGLGASFALAGVEPAQALALRVVQAPAAPLVLAGVVLAGLGLGLGALRPAEPRHQAAPAVMGGLLLCGALVALGGGAVLQWSWIGNRDTTALAIPAAGLPLGLALVASLGGALVVAAPLLASGAAAPARLLTFGRRGQILGATLACLGAGVLLFETGLGFGTAHEAALLALLAGGVAASLASEDAAGIPRAAAAGATLLLAVVGVASWIQAGGYDTLAVESVASVALLALAASE